jgi:hypothetical protein
MHLFLAEEGDMLDSRTKTFWALLVLSGLLGFPERPVAAPVTFSGTIAYQGSYAGDTLFVAVLDTTGVQDVTLLDLQAFPMGAPPWSQPYTLAFDNAAVSPILLVASFLDVDGGGVDSIGGADVFGWYAGGSSPAGISAASSQSGLDFALPRAEIHGTITLAPGQIEARVDASADPTCQTEGFRPGHYAWQTGSYAIIGLYPGTYCVSADGPTLQGFRRVCYGDPSCTNSPLVTLSETEVRNGIHLDFTAISALERFHWSGVKSLYRVLEERSRP